LTSAPHPGRSPEAVALPSPARFVVAVASGKGGVGKSTISLNLAAAFAEDGHQVGLLDADFYGPDIPLMVGVSNTKLLKRWALWSHQELGGVRLEPLERDGIKIVSVGLVLAEQQALAWPAEMVEFVGRQFLTAVDWGELDYLVIDMPPGTGDILQQLLALLPVMAAIVAVTPQDVAHLDAKRILELLRDGGIRILGGVENMASLECPHCAGNIALFPAVSPERSIWAQGVERLGVVPLDPPIAHAGDSGRPIVVAAPQSVGAHAFRGLADAVISKLQATG
jgi:ATP-binding protein involved in chromosome partitioning